MNIALFNVKITIQKNTVIVDEIGNHINEWSDFHTCFATVNGENSSEKSSAGGTWEETDITFTIRYCKALDNISAERYRVIFNGSVFNIVSIDHLNYKRKCLKIRCKRERASNDGTNTNTEFVR